MSEEEVKLQANQSEKCKRKDHLIFKKRNNLQHTGIQFDDVGWPSYDNITFLISHWMEWHGCIMLHFCCPDLN